MSKSLLFLSVISLMLFFLALAGDERARPSLRFTEAPIAHSEEIRSPESRTGRAPASVARTLEIEPVLPGDE